MAQKLEIIDVKHVFDERGFVLLDDVYVNSETPLRYRCKCGNESKMSYKNAKKGRNCAECGRKSQSVSKTKFTIDFIREYFEDNDCHLISKEYKPSRDKTKNKLSYICSCGNIAKISWYQAFHNGTNCSNCRTLKAIEARTKYTIEELRSFFASKGKVLLETEFKNSITPMLYVCKCGRQSRTNLNNFLKGKDCYDCRNDKISELMKDPDLTNEERELRRSLRENKEWRLAVYQRDDYTCQCCGNRGGEINAHHILNFADNPEVRTVVENGITLCVDCHKDFHKRYGVRNTNDQQLAEFLSNRGGE